MSTPILAPKVAIILQVKVTFDLKDRETFIKYFKPAYDKVIAEPECVYFFVGENAQEPGVFRWTEGWTKDMEWLINEQLPKEYYKPYLEATEPLFTSERVIEAYTPLEGMGHITL